MTNPAKILSVPAAKRGSTLSPRCGAWGWRSVLRELLAGALLLAAWLALWTTTWAAVAGPLSPLHREAPRRARPSAVERA
jgi:hypothetical protein